MPKDKLKDERDGNPKTVYEDTKAHERIGLRQDDSIEVLKKQNSHLE
ncbi:hypothetical protein [Paenibacillus thermotolerans]|nr:MULTISPECIES: hypothetical protein [unclassified Paenibacillus]